MPLKSKHSIAVITGGYSNERVVSLKSCKNVIESIDKNLFTPYIIEISKKKWNCLYNGKNIPVDKNDFSVTIKSKKIKFSLIVFALHGTPAEDGKLQGYFDLIGIPFLGCNNFISALTFNKYFTNIFARAHGIRVEDSILINSNRNLKKKLEEKKHLISYPCFVKPNKSGSSFGASKVRNFKELELSVKKSFQEDDEVLIEKFILGRELTIGVLEMNGKIKALPITEAITKNPFFDFNAKYNKEALEITPAEIPKEIELKIKETAIKIYQVFQCQGIIRIDFILKKSTSQFYFLEINTIPGLTNQSFIPQQFEKAKLSFERYLTKTIMNKLDKKNNEFR